MATTQSPAGTTSQTSAPHRPVLAGGRYRTPGTTPVYLIDPAGCRRWIPNPDTFNNLFPVDAPIINDSVTDEIYEETQLDDGAFLVRAAGTDPVYLVSNGEKRWIVSPAVMAKYAFDSTKVQIYPAAAVNAMLTGADWT